MELRKAVALARELSQASKDERRQIMDMARDMAGEPPPGRPSGIADASNGAQRVKRKRRTKAEMEAARASETARDERKADLAQQIFPDNGPAPRTDIPETSAPVIPPVEPPICAHMKLFQSASAKPGRSILCEECDILVQVPFPAPHIMKT